MLVRFQPPQLDHPRQPEHNKHGPVAQRRRQHPYKVTIGGSSPPGTTRLGRQLADHPGLEPRMLRVRIPPEPLTCRPSQSSPECSPARHAGDHGFESRRGRCRQDTARYANRQSGEAQTFVSAGSTPACATWKPCVGWAPVSPTDCKSAASGCAGSTPARRTFPMARSSIGTGHRPLKPERRVRFPHGLLRTEPSGATGRRATLRTSCPRGLGSSNLPLATLICRRAGAQPAVMRRVRPVRYRGLQLPTGYANRQSGEVEGLVPAGSTPAPVTAR